VTKRLDGKRTLIFGASPNNLGHALARRFLNEGARVAIAGRDAAKTASLARDLGAVGVAADLADVQAIDRMVGEAAEALGGLDVAINSTGWSLLKPFLETTEEDLLRMSAVQFIGPFRYFQAALRAMSDGGSIIQISSITATIMMDDHAAYMGTKAGMDHIIRCIANEFGARGIRANSIAAGGIADAPMSGGGLKFDPIRKLYAREIPLDRPGESADIANAAVWLASDEANFVTGQVIHVSGGQTLRRNPALREIYAAAMQGQGQT
jgi:2-hydroxycyclohexanecarboxyl-CoA dehydrogenase